MRLPHVRIPHRVAAISRHAVMAEVERMTNHPVPLGARTAALKREP
jgi:hypothetical protein